MQPGRPLPFDVFLDVLRAKGYGVSLHEYSAVAHLLARWEGVAATNLADALAALIGRNADEVEGIRALFLEIYAPPETPPPPPPPPVDRTGWLRANAWALAAAAAVLSAALAVRLWPAPQPPPPAVPSVVPSVTAPATGAAVVLPPPPAPDLPPPPERTSRSVVATVAAGAFLAALAGFWLLKIRERRRLWLRDAWTALRATLPGPFHFDETVRMPIRLPKADIEDAATLLGRVYSRHGQTRELDVKRTLQATMRNGLMPTFVTRPRRSTDALLVLRDVCQEMQLWNAKVDGFLADLRRQGITLVTWYFDGDLSRISERPHRPSIALDGLLRVRPDSPVMVVSSGHGLAALLDAGDETWLRSLRDRPRTTWLTPVADLRLWPEAFAALPLDVWPMTRTGLVAAARQLADVDSVSGMTLREQLAREGFVHRQDIERLKRLASLAPHPSPALLESLRREFAPDVPDAAIVHVMNDADGPSAPVIALTDREVAFNASMMRRESPDLELAVRTAVLGVLEDSEPVAGSAAHERWQIAVASQQLQIAELRGSDADRTIALERLRTLARAPLGDEVTDILRLAPSTPGTTAEVRRLEREQRRLSALPGDDRDRLRAAVPQRWAWPGPRELVPASLATASLLLASLGLNVLPARALEHLTGVYGLEYAPRPSAVTPQLTLSVSGAEADVPRDVDLYRGNQIFRRGLALDPSAATAVQLTAADTGFHYQVRATLPAGNLAVSPWVWVPSDRLSFVLIDASPWANVTITGGSDTTAVQQTPFTAALLPGSYRLHFENPALGPRAVLDQSLTVPGVPAMRVTMPGFDPARTVDSLVNTQPAATTR